MEAGAGESLAFSAVAFAIDPCNPGFWGDLFREDKDGFPVGLFASEAAADFSDV
jgi:hypothetical protein